VAAGASVAGAWVAIGAGLPQAASKTLNRTTAAIERKTFNFDFISLSLEI
jgi:hypothetical protein